jgi:hypothetical protein
MLWRRPRLYDGPVLMPEIVPYLGRYCEIATRSERLFGDLVRLSAASLMVRAKWPASAALQIVQASEIVEIIDLPDPHL